MIETEVKIKITKDEFNKFVNLFNKPPFFNQENILYEIPGGFVRIRREKGKKIISLKKSVEGNFNSCEEIEFETESGIDIIKEFIKNIGLRETLTYRKRRANIRQNECIISLDILEESSYYIEVEGAPEKIKQILSELKLENHKPETKSYLEILR